MNTLWLFVIIIVGILLVACIAGVAAGRYQLNKARGKRSLLSAKERIIYAVSIVLGCACIAFGILYKAPQKTADLGMVEIPGITENPGINYPADEQDDTQDSISIADEQAEDLQDETQDEQGELAEEAKPEDKPAANNPAPGGNTGGAVTPTPRTLTGGNAAVTANG